MKKISRFSTILFAFLLPYTNCIYAQKTNPFSSNTTVTDEVSDVDESLGDLCRVAASKIETTAMSGQGVVRINMLNVRQEPWGDILGVITEGTTVEITGQKGDWYQINYNGQTAYVHSKWIVVDGMPRTVPDNCVVTNGAGVKVLETLGGKTIGSFPAGSSLPVLADCGDYWKIKYNGYEAYVPKNDVQPTDYPSNTAVASNNSNTNTNTNGNSSNNNNGSQTIGNTQAKDFYELGTRAYNEWQEYTENSARGEWIRKVGEIVKNTNTYGMKKSLIIAQIINESGWMKPSKLHDFNNVLGINTDMGRIKPSMQSSTWSKKQTAGYNNVTQWNSEGKVVGTYESMRHYDSIEECIEDYANVMSLYHPECVGNNNLEAYRSFLEGYTPNPNESTTDRYRRIIDKYGLEKYDE